VSKAFTRESDDSQPEEMPIVRRQLPPGARNYITREGADRLRQRMDCLLQERQSLKASTSEGGAAVDAERRRIDAAIYNLQQTLSSVVVADIPADREKVAFGATVVIRRGDGEEERYRIVGMDEADPEGGSISWLSPLARALLSRRAGERVGFREEELTILSVGY